MSIHRPTRIVVVGCGAVGATTAYTLLLRERCEELVLIDVRRDVAHGEALDFRHGLPFTGKTKVWAGDYADCAGADIVIVAAGAAQRPGETRQDLLPRNAAVVQQVVAQVVEHNQDGILLIATNPVDVMAYAAWKTSQWPAHRVIGSGTVLDSARFRFAIGRRLGMDPRNVHAYIVGEHGDTELPVWSSAHVAGAPVSLPPEEKDEIFRETRDAAYEIIRAKGATNYAIALALDRIVTAILRDEGAVLTVSTYLDDYLGVRGIYMGVPCIVDRTGVREVLPLHLDETEARLFAASAAALQAAVARLPEHA
ncbi:L-lactate dehydrogenase 2 [Alicyclobacillus cellulosilyticus]|uniref:L-lactate dehydrogenase n=1 Tax=Alicyclobacillus cellulosilyticus TaxID=1003997 RepID=A0A917NMM0_9BACL|nr:L-lactate dehydrogenase [Alicyclobacillus cellulosilyticus]GGJ12294.1 L-lactate dehydrogenase 2 [Alicyclobacillus cellulosilyticus]